MITVSNVVNASRGELLCMTYELLLEEIEKASKIEEMEERKVHIDKAIKVLQMLAEDLNFEVELSKELFRIYVYVQGLLVNGRHTEKLEEAYKLIHKIYEAYKKIADEEESKAPSMENAEKIYAGLTYGKTSVNEITIGIDNRGFKA